MINPFTELRDFGQAALLRPVPRDHAQSDAAFRRRRIVAGVTLVMGAVMLAYSLRIPAGDPSFYWWTIALALVWTVGAFASGPLHLGRAWTRDGGVGQPLVQSLALAVLITGIFLAGAVVVAQIPALRGPVDELLDHARYGSLPLVWAITMINGVGEELYFRGALFAAIGRRHAVAISTLVYTLTTVGTGIPLLVLAAAMLGFLCALQRRVTGGVLGPIIVHCLWSSSMLFLLPIMLDVFG
ncbi:CPBP family intramembrane glutamic endopeptidase [Mobilicoccus caccae]|uniref:CAAX protease family protein n=1 Tax=Mobilicoccus caccae TaxID=1859295 RepID=A0ABQ6IUG5_9MICO|nr:type II CAAX endopeptidase family protein [Mobilicoccus caccae]GMA41573.1 CAAX protease family protein [Mobilicoccus caccae]